MKSYMHRYSVDNISRSFHGLGLQASTDHSINVGEHVREPARINCNNNDSLLAVRDGDLEICSYTSVLKSGVARDGKLKVAMSKHDVWVVRVKEISES